MRLSQFADFGLRALMYLGVHEGERVTTEDLAEAYGISKFHLQKVVRRLKDAGLVALHRGRSGGLELALAPGEVSIGRALRALDQDSTLVECFDPDSNSCVISPTCALKGPLASAQEAFYAELDSLMLADLLHRRSAALKRHWSG